MEYFVNLRMKINNDIDKINDQNNVDEKNIYRMEKLLKIIDDIINKIKNDNYNIEISDIDEIKADFNGYNTIMMELDKLREAIIIINYVDEFGILEPQINAAKDSAKIFSNVLEKISRRLIINISLIKEKIDGNNKLIDKYKSYLSVFNDSGLIGGVDITLLNDFFDYVSRSNLSDEDKYKIIFEFSKYNLAIYEKNYLDKMNSVRFEISKNIRNVEMSIIEETKTIAKEIEKIDEEKIEEQEEIDKSIDEIIEETDVFNEEVVFDEEEQMILEQIYEILNLFDDSFANIDLLNVLKSDDYGLSVRKNIYSSTNLVLICYDISNNLINNINSSNKKDIFEVFKHVINLYEEYLSNVNSTEIIFIDDDSQTLINECLDNYRDMVVNDEERKLIDSYYTSIDYKLSTKELVNMFYGKYNILNIILHKKLNDLYKGYLADRMAGFELYESGDMEIKDINIDLEKTISLIDNILNKISELNEIIFHDKFPNIDNIDSNSINALIFLNPEHIEEDRKSILKYGAGSLSGIRQLIASLKLKSIVDLRKINNTKFFGESYTKKNMDYDFRKLKSGYGRVTYVVVSILDENKKILSEKGYISPENGNILLSFGIGSKFAGENEVYNASKKRIINNFSQIEHIMKIFSKKFTPETLNEAIELLEHGRIVSSKLFNGEEISISVTDNTKKGRK